MKRKRLTEQDRKAIVMMSETGQWTRNEIAHSYGVNYDCISKIIRKDKEMQNGEDVENDVEKGKSKAVSVKINPIKLQERLINLQDVLEENEKLAKSADKLFEENEELKKQIAEIEKNVDIMKEWTSKLNEFEELKKEKTILDAVEVRLINKTLMQENEELRGENEKLKDLSKRDNELMAKYAKELERLNQDFIENAEYIKRIEKENKKLLEENTEIKLNWVNYDKSRFEILTQNDKYSELNRVFTMALSQASDGKGKERHANDESFENQKICELNRFIGSNHGLIYQACKKSIESNRLPKERAISEILGAINYLAAAVILKEEEV